MRELAAASGEPALYAFLRRALSTAPFGRTSSLRTASRLFRISPRFRARIAGLSFEIDLEDHVSATLYAYGAFEPEIASLVVKLLRPGATFLDLGANFGYFSILAGQVVGDQGKVIAFEPDPRNYERLVKHVALNGMGQVICIAKGIADRSGRVSLFLASGDEGNLGNSSIVRTPRARSEVCIDVITLDEYFAGAGATRVDLMKMDIEGGEVLALWGADRSLAEHRMKMLLVEIHGGILGESHAEECRSLLLRAGYRGWLIGSGQRRAGRPLPSLVPLSGSQPPPSSRAVNSHTLWTADEKEVERLGLLGP